MATNRKPKQSPALLRSIQFACSQYGFTAVSAEDMYAIILTTCDTEEAQEQAKTAFMHGVVDNYVDPNDVERFKQYVPGSAKYIRVGKADEVLVELVEGMKRELNL